MDTSPIKTEQARRNALIARLAQHSSGVAWQQRCVLPQGGVRALLAIDANFGELAFERESATEAEARVTRHAREIAAQLSERARREARKLPFPR